jgi:diacylglycerol kinase family enzyme
MQLEMDGGRRQEIEQGHLILIANMPYLGPRFHPSADVTHDDGQLDVFVFGGLGKLDLLSYVVQLTASGVADPRVTHYQARRVEVHTTPPMPAMVDGVMLGREDGSGALRITLHHHAVHIIAARAG